MRLRKPPALSAGPRPLSSDHIKHAEYVPHIQHIFTYSADAAAAAAAAGDLDDHVPASHVASTLY